MRMNIHIFLSDFNKNVLSINIHVCQFKQPPELGVLVSAH